MDRYYWSNRSNLNAFIENDNATLLLEKEEFGTKSNPFKIPKSLTICWDDDTNAPSGEYPITEIIVNCKEWHIFIPKDIKNVTIKRMQEYDKDIEFGTSQNSTFEVEETNKYLKSSKVGSLYTKDGRDMIHYHSNDEVPISVENIRPEAIYKPGESYKLIIPLNCKKLAEKAIQGEFETLDFTGGIEFIEPKALDNIDCKEFRINGLLSNINAEGQEELCKWVDGDRYFSKYTHNLFLAVPNPSISKALETGFIELTEVLPLREKLRRHEDSCTIYINAYINERVKSGDNIEKSNWGGLPISIKTDIIDNKDKDYSPYSRTEITRIAFIRMTEYEQIKEIFVHEPVNRVMELIKESFAKAKGQ